MDDRIWGEADGSPNPMTASLLSENPEANLVPRFMYSSAAELEAADQYREAGLPYILTNIPTLDASRALWESDGYIQHQFDAQSRHDYQVLRSENTRFLYHGPVLTFINLKKKKKTTIPPAFV